MERGLNLRAHRALRLPLEALMAHTKDGSGSRLIVATSSVVPLGPTSLVPSHSLPWQMEEAPHVPECSHVREEEVVFCCVTRNRSSLLCSTTH